MVTSAQGSDSIMWRVPTYHTEQEAVQAIFHLLGNGFELCDSVVQTTCHTQCAVLIPGCIECHSHDILSSTLNQAQNGTFIIQVVWWPLWSTKHGRVSLCDSFILTNVTMQSKISLNFWLYIQHLEDWLWFSVHLISTLCFSWVPGPVIYIDLLGRVLFQAGPKFQIDSFEISICDTSSLAPTCDVTYDITVNSPVPLKQELRSLSVIWALPLLMAWNGKQIMLDLLIHAANSCVHKSLSYSLFTQ